MKHHTHHLEVNHSGEFERYVIFTKKLDYLPNYVTRLVDVNLDELSSLEIIRHGELREVIISNNFTDDLSQVYYTATRPIYEDPDGQFRVHINDTNDILFNIPINLMLVSSCTDKPSKTYRRTGCNVRVTRHQSQVSIKSYDNYAIDSIHFTDVMNVLSPRSLQFVDMANLINDISFTHGISNGNLTLAYADIYHNNNDEDIVVIKNPTPKIALIRYDQFTGVVNNNMVEVVLADDLDNPLYFNSYLRDSWLVEILTDCIKHYLTTLRTTHD